MVRCWGEDLVDERFRRQTIDTVHPILRDWCNGEFGFLSFGFVQVLSGYGCFGQYLHKIARRQPRTACHDCNAAKDTVNHTISNNHCIIKKINFSIRNLKSHQSHNLHNISLVFTFIFNLSNNYMYLYISFLIYLYLVYLLINTYDDLRNLITKCI